MVGLASQTHVFRNKHLGNDGDDQVAIVCHLDSLLDHHHGMPDCQSSFKTHAHAHAILKSLQ